MATLQHTVLTFFFAGVFKSGRPLRVKSASMQERNLLADSTFDKLQFNIVWEM